MEDHCATIRYTSAAHQHFRFHSQLPPSLANSPQKMNSVCLNRDSRGKEDKTQREYEERLVECRQLMESFKLEKQERIRVNQWLVKLSIRPSNSVWQGNVNYYLQVLAEMLREGCLTQPFLSPPSDGPLPKLTAYDLPYPVRQHMQNSQSGRSRSKPKQPQQSCILTKSISLINGNSCQLGSTVLMQDELSLDMLVVPTHTSNKVRKQHLSNHSSNNQANKQERTLNRGQGGGLSRQLFASKEKNTTMQTESLKSQNYSHSESQESQQTVTNIKGFAVLKKMFVLLTKNEAILASENGYDQLVTRILQLANKLKIDLDDSLDSSLNSSILSEQTQALVKVSQNIHQKFTETDRQTVEFLSFIRNLRG